MDAALASRGIATVSRSPPKSLPRGKVCVQYDDILLRLPRNICHVSLGLVVSFFSRQDLGEW